MKSMRKIFCMVVGLMVMMISSVAFANYPTYLNGDSNYILVDGHQGVAWYVDKSSLNVQEYNPPSYIIAINVVRAVSADGTEDGLYNGGEGTISGVETYRFVYEYDKKTMYRLSGTYGGGKLTYLDPNGSWAQNGVALPTGEMAFYLAYGIPFYGCYNSSFYSEAN